MDWKKMVKPAHEVEGFSKGNVAKARTASAVVAQTIDKQIELFNKPRQEGRRMFRIEGENVAFTVRYANSPLKLLGEDKEVAVPKDKFVEVLNAIKADVEKGAFNPQLEAMEQQVKARSAKMGETRRSKKAEA
ncbi:hypothetical protein [Sphingomonas sp. Ag1]|jgi:hypothetical protein|uniref:hypothetical protein n=1 Tax=Sphingomonas sp. Ag1 TaxID=1642949 RepID=UPI000697B9A1|nr:hypothetical protein [Sphingomonas sp. Ag1]